MQWLFRTEPIDDTIRLPKLLKYKQEIEFVFEKFIKEGLVGAVGTFPYTTAFGKEVSDKIVANSGWISYWNLLEREYLENLPANQWFIGLRPLTAGRIFSTLEKLDDNIIEDLTPVNDLNKEQKLMNLAMRYCLSDDRVKTNVLSINNQGQAQSLHKIMQHSGALGKNEIDLLINSIKVIS